MHTGGRLRYLARFGCAGRAAGREPRGGPRRLPDEHLEFSADLRRSRIQSARGSGEARVLRSGRQDHEARARHAGEIRRQGGCEGVACVGLDGG